MCIRDSAEAFVKRLGELRRGGAGEARAVAFSGAGVKRELADAEQFALAKWLAHLAFGVIEDPQSPHLLGEPVTALLIIPGPDSKQHAEPGADRADRFPIDAHRGASDSLNKRPHLPPAYSPPASATMPAATTTIAVLQAIAPTMIFRSRPKMWPTARPVMPLAIPA